MMQVKVKETLYRLMFKSSIPWNSKDIAIYGKIGESKQADWRAGVAVYVDDYLLSAEVPNGGRTVKSRWSHLLADTRTELDDMADALGMRRSWIQYPGTWKEHYDVVASRRLKAIKLGAIPIACLSQDWVDVQNAKRLLFDKPLLRENLTVAHITVLIGAPGRYQSRCLIHAWFGEFYDYREFAAMDADNHNRDHH